MAYAQSSALVLGIHYAEGSAFEVLHPNGTITPITAENSVAYTKADGLVENRAIFKFAVVAFEGVFSFNFSESTSLYFRVVPHLLRYTLLDVDKPPPTSYVTPAKLEDYCDHPGDDYGD